METNDIPITPGQQTHLPHLTNLIKFLAVAVLVMVIGLALFYLTMQPSAHDLGLMVILMGVTTVLSVVISYLALRFGWIFHSPRLRYSLIGGYLVAAGLVFLNVWVSARIMFTSQHDLLLATILLIFATSMAVALGFFISEGIILRIMQIQTAAGQVAAGQLSTRLPVIGNDEVASLAISFNKMVAQLEEAERHKQELDVLRRDLIAWVGHDLRTPLTSIRAIVEALADGMLEDETQRNHYLAIARSDIRTLSSLIDDLFEMAQIDAGGLKLEKVSVSIADLISDTLEQFTSQARQAGIELKGKVGADIQPLNIDVPRIGRALANLVSNAIQHTPVGGRVSIEAVQLDKELLISVIDTGEGINPEDLPHIFERFYRGEKSRSRVTGGAGLGLAITRGIVELHGGKIGVNSQGGQGTEVWFRLPV